MSTGCCLIAPCVLVQVVQVCHSDQWITITSTLFQGLISMTAGQALVTIAAQTADRNFWASTREMEEDELVGFPAAGYKRCYIYS